MKIKGVKTNRRIPAQCTQSSDFPAGNCDTGFIADNPELLNISASRRQGAEACLTFLGEKFVNGNRGVKPQFDVPVFPRIKPDAEIAKLSGTKQILDEKGAQGVVDWVEDQKKTADLPIRLCVTRSSPLMATRVRTVDMEKIAPATARLRQRSLLAGNVGWSNI